jgi:hypothetical protein
MIHIEGRNISPYLPDDPHLRMLCAGDRERFEMNLKWRNQLGEILEKLAHAQSYLKDQEVTCWFGHDPSVPTDPYPTALFIVKLPRGLLPRQIIDCQDFQRGYATILGKAMKEFLDKMRGSDNAKVQVYIELVKDNTGYSTPEKK